MKIKENNKYHVIITNENHEREIQDFDTLTEALGYFDWLCENEEVYDVMVELAFRDLVQDGDSEIEHWRSIDLMRK